MSGTHTPVAYCPPQSSQVHPKAAFKGATNVTPNASCREKTIVEQPSISAHFSKPFSASQIEQKCKPSIPKNTQVNTSWAVSVFDQWVAYRNSWVCSADDKCSVSLLTIVHPTGAVDYWLVSFILEARRKDCQYYPVNTVRNILAAIFRHMRTVSTILWTL